ncbi:hypothetical protein SAMN02910456_02233 [Ruminococcaceae bacterium YRB3002]|nr:hypothetical protein SAMN02910456_02233 [Ruminococcaceae bacterium YRB3002]
MSSEKWLWNAVLRDFSDGFSDTGRKYRRKNSSEVPFYVIFPMGFPIQIGSVIGKTIPGDRSLLPPTVPPDGGTLGGKQAPKAPFNRKIPPAVPPDGGTLGGKQAPKAPFIRKIPPAVPPGGGNLGGKQAPKAPFNRKIPPAVPPGGGNLGGTLGGTLTGTPTATSVSITAPPRHLGTAFSRRSAEKTAEILAKGANSDKMCFKGFDEEFAWTGVVQRRRRLVRASDRCLSVCSFRAGRKKERSSRTFP